MRLTTDELPELPLSACWVRDDGLEIAHTPEWSGGGADTVQYRSGAMRLVVETREHQPQVAALSRMVLHELDVLVEETSSHLADVRRALCASLRLVMGAPDSAIRPVADVLTTAAAAAREENVDIALVAPTTTTAVAGGDTVALVLKQLATNARKHDDARDLRLSADERGAFRLQWRGSGTRAAIETSRHPDQRERWGLGLVRLAADALGASVIPARHLDGGDAEAVFTPSAADGRLTLPLAALSEAGVVERATRAWDEETGITPGAHLQADLEALRRRAHEHPGKCVAEGPFTARASMRRTWIALAPASTRDHARDLIAGIAHERALVGESADALRLTGAAEALAVLLGAPIEMWIRQEFDAALSRACRSFGVDNLTVSGSSTVAPPASLVAFLASLGDGGRLRLAELAWRYTPHRRGPLIDALLAMAPVAA